VSKRKVCKWVFLFRKKKSYNVKEKLSFHENWQTSPLKTLHKGGISFRKRNPTLAKKTKYEIIQSSQNKPLKTKIV